MTAQTNNAQADVNTKAEPQSKSNFLTKVLRADGVFATFSGLVVMIGSQALASLFELEYPAALLILGFVFLLYGLDLLYFTGRGENNRNIAIFAITVNLIYAIASFAGILFDLFPIILVLLLGSAFPSVIDVVGPAMGVIVVIAVVPSSAVPQAIPALREGWRGGSSFLGGEVDCMT